MTNYLRWQFVDAPRWLVQTMWNLELALLQFFSVGLMLRTLFAHWHKDAVSYTNRSFTGIFVTFAWNQISRTIGFLVRTAALTVYTVIQVIYFILAVSFLALFLLWPFIALAGLAIGLVLMFAV